jgi:carbonic anhydrase
LTAQHEGRPAPGDRSSEFLRLLAENQRYTDAFDRSALTAAPLSGLAIVACMDARLDVEEALGLRTGDAHIIRNAGAIVTEDVIRSLIISQHLLGTDEIVVIAHTGCGLIDADEVALRERLARETGQSYDITFGSFHDLTASVRSSIGRLRAHAWLRPGPIHGLIFDVATGRLHEVADG